MPGIPSGKAQLAAAQLDNLGSSDRGDSVKLSQTAQTLIDMAEHLITTAGNNLNKSGAVATGDLESSMKARDIEINGSSMVLDIEILDRYRFTDQGVNGVEKSQQSPYSFKTKRPSLKMQKAIKSWARVRARRATKYKPISRVETKDKRLAKIRKEADSINSLAWAMATSIKKNGIKRTRFFTKAIKSTEIEMKKRISDSYRIDIINNLKNGTGN